MPSRRLGLAIQKISYLHNVNLKAVFKTDKKSQMKLNKTINKTNTFKLSTKNEQRRVTDVAMCAQSPTTKVMTGSLAGMKKKHLNEK